MNTNSMINEFLYMSQSPGETKKLGQMLGKLLHSGDLIALEGDLGAGKTCLIQGIARGFNSDDQVSSPSFSLIKEYHGDKPIYHFDLYRLSHSREIEDLGYEEYFYGNGITLIEWAERIKPYLPQNLLWIKIDMGNEFSYRKISLRAYGNRYQKILKEIKNIEDIKH